MWVAAGVVGVGALGAGLGYLGATKSSKAQREAAEAAADVQWRIYKQSREDIMPWLEAGEKALETYQQRIEAGPGSFRESEYGKMLAGAAEDAYRRSQRAYNAAGAVGGRSARGAAQAVTDITSQYYGNWLQKWMAENNLFQTAAGLGQTSAANLGNLGASAAGNIGAAQMAAGQASAAGYQGQTNAIVGGIQSGLDLASVYYGNKPKTTAPSQTSAYGPYAGGYQYPIYNPSF